MRLIAAIARHDLRLVLADRVRLPVGLGYALENRMALGRATGGLLASVERYEELDELTGRLGSFAFLNYARDTSNADSTKFMGDMQDALTSLSTKLIFYSLELNRIEDEVLNGAFEREEGLRRYRPWFDELLTLRSAQPQVAIAREETRDGILEDGQHVTSRRVFVPQGVLDTHPSRKLGEP